MRDLLALIRMRTFSAVLPNSGSDSMLTEPPAAQGEQNAIRVMRFKGFEKVARPKEILRTTSTQALYSLSWARYELLISNRQTVYKTDIALIAEFL